VQLSRLDVGGGDGAEMLRMADGRYSPSERGTEPWQPNGTIRQQPFVAGTSGIGIAATYSGFPNSSSAAYESQLVILFVAA